MPNQLTSNAEALRLFFTDDIFLVNDTAVDYTKDAKSDLVVRKELPPTAVQHQVTDEQVIEAPALVTPKIVDFKFVGGNEKQILILVNDHENEVSTEDGRALLRNLVKAIGLTGKDFALLNYAAYQDAVFTDLQAHFNCRLMISFGVAADQLGLTNFPLHQLVAHGDIKMIFTANLHQLHADKAAKSALWTSLQKLNNG